MKNKIKLFLNFNFILCLSLTILFAIEVDPDKITQMQIKAIQQQLKKKTISETTAVPQKVNSPESIVQLDYPGSEIDSAQLENKSLNHFGYSFFNTKGSRAIADNQPPPAGYTLGPGDEVIIEIWGDTQLRSSHIIDLYGKIYVDKIGQVQIAELNLNDIEKKLLNKFKHVYSSLKGNEPSANLDVSIGKLKSINVTILGESLSLGIHAIHPFSTIITGLLQIGGVKTSGSLRDIQLIRNGKIYTSLDLYQYLLMGHNFDDFRLLDGDILFIPIRYSSITIKGEVIRGGIYELLPNETLENLIKYVGGLTVRAQKNMHIHRLKSMNEISEFSPVNENFSINYLKSKDFILQNGDNIDVYPIIEGVNEIYVYGQVKKSGKYAFDTNQDMFLLDILTFAGGFNDSTYLKTIFLEKGEIIRNHPDSKFPEILNFNINKLLSGDLNENLRLQNWDIVVIRQNPLFAKPDKVWILGEINMPGIYTLQKKDETLNDVLIRAKGLSPDAFKYGLHLKRGGKQVALDNYNIILHDSDSVLVPKHPGVVEVQGEVYKPGFIQYYKNKSLRKYIEGAGGFTIDANKYHITVVHANGEVEINKIFKSPTIREGSTIIVQKAEETEPFSLTELSSNMASIITSFATLILLFGQ
ncbi:MAG: SLBB domain-containing protein [Candidatus Marinimicrobia bacterium]|nr:SLBB domain-containing protein [Candidatus Neomarinimicrobiota bacterium]